MELDRPRAALNNGILNSSEEPRIPDSWIATRERTRISRHVLLSNLSADNRKAIGMKLDNHTA